VEQTGERMLFDFLPGLPIVVETQPTLMSRDGGIPPLRPFHAQIGFTGRFIDGLDDPRDPAPTHHGFEELVRQRIYGILAGYAEGDQGGSTKATTTTPCDPIRCSS